MTKALYERCTDQHPSTGTIGYPVDIPQGWTYTGPHASVQTCGSGGCIASANSHIRRITGQDGVFRTFGQARAESRER
jgi:hypothetical protein